MPRLSPITLREMSSHLRADYRRLASLLMQQPGGATMTWLHPAFVSVLLYRISNYLFRRSHNLTARIVWQVNFILTGADVSPGSDLGPGLVILSPAGVSLMGKAGRNLTVMPCAGLGGEMGDDTDLGAGPGLPVLGDDVVLEPHGGVLGPVHIGNRVRVRAGVVLTHEVPDDTEVEGPRARWLARRSA